MKRTVAAYSFPAGLLYDRLDKRPVWPWVRRVVYGLMVPNLLTNLAVMALPFERLYSLLRRMIYKLFS